MEPRNAHAEAESAFDHYTRTYNDMSTWIAEVLNGSMRTPFEYQYDGTDLRAEDGSRLRPIFQDAIADAERLAAHDQRLGFELRRRTLEYEEYFDMIAMCEGKLPNTMVVVSDFPHELMTADEDVGGYNVSRKQTMLRVLYKDEHGVMNMVSQSLDGSDRAALEAIYTSLNVQPRPGELLRQRIHLDMAHEDQVFVIDQLMGQYDHSLTRTQGGEWYAGQLISPDEVQMNTYDFAREQTDILSDIVHRSMNGTLTKQRLFGAVALLEKRYEAARRQETIEPWMVGGASVGAVALQRQMLEDAIFRAAQEAGSDGKVFSGCGFSLSASEGASMSGDEQLGEAGYGNKAEEEDEFGSLEFKCPKGHRNRRPRGKLLDNCKSCGTSVRC